MRHLHLFSVIAASLILMFACGPTQKNTTTKSDNPTSSLGAPQQNSLIPLNADTTTTLSHEYLRVIVEPTQTLEINARVSIPGTNPFSYVTTGKLLDYGGKFQIIFPEGVNPSPISYEVQITTSQDIHNESIAVLLHVRNDENDDYTPLYIPHSALNVTSQGSTVLVSFTIDYVDIEFSLYEGDGTTIPDGFTAVDLSQENPDDDQEEDDDNEDNDQGGSSSLPGAFSLGAQGPFSTAIPTITWDISANAETYHVKVSLDAEGTQIVSERTGVVDAEAEVGPLVTGTYYVFVDAINASGTTSSSNSITISVSVTASGDEIAFVMRSFHMSSPAQIYFEFVHGKEDQWTRVPIKNEYWDAELSQGIDLARTDNGEYLAHYTIPYGATQLHFYTASSTDGDSWDVSPLETAPWDNDAEIMFGALARSVTWGNSTYTLWLSSYEQWYAPYESYREIRGRLNAGPIETIFAVDYDTYILVNLISAANATGRADFMVQRKEILPSTGFSVLHYTSSGGVWASGSQEVVDLGCPSNLTLSDLKLTSQSTLVLVYACGNNLLLRTNQGGVWSVATQIDSNNNIGGAYYTAPKIHIDANDAIHLIYNKGTGIYYATNSWGADITSPSYVGSGVIPRLMISQSGVPQVIWKASAGYQDMLSYAELHEGTWVTHNAIIFPEDVMFDSLSISVIRY